MQGLPLDVLTMNRCPAVRDDVNKPSDSQSQGQQDDRIVLVVATTSHHGPGLAAFKCLPGGALA